VSDIASKAGKLFVLAAPSGCGKTTLVYKLVDQMRPHCSFERVVTFTSRAARPTDRPGCDYHFISAQEFQDRIQQNFFLEWSTAYGSYYGTPKTLIEQVERGACLITVVDHVGVQSITKKYPKTIGIWLVPPSFEILEHRLRGRGTENVADIERRLQLAGYELELEQQTRFCKYHIINDAIDSTLEQLKAVVLSEIGLLKK